MGVFLPHRRFVTKDYWLLRTSTDNLRTAVCQGVRNRPFPSVDKECVFSIPSFCFLYFSVYFCHKPTKKHISVAILRWIFFYADLTCIYLGIKVYYLRNKKCCLEEQVWKNFSSYWFLSYWPCRSLLYCCWIRRVRFRAGMFCPALRELCFLLIFPLECVCCTVIIRNFSGIAKADTIQLCHGEYFFLSAGELSLWICFLKRNSADILKTDFLLLALIFSDGHISGLPWFRSVWFICWSVWFWNCCRKEVCFESFQFALLCCDCSFDRMLRNPHWTQLYRYDKVRSCGTFGKIRRAQPLEQKSVCNRNIRCRNCSAALVR